MTFAPQTLKDLMALWTSNDGTNSGIVGDAAHATRSSYHNGFDVACAASGVTTLTALAEKDYSYRLARDHVKSNAAAALDLGQLHGSLANLQKFSRWLVAQAQANPTKYRDVREIIYSPDGTVVKRWSGPDNRVYAVVLDNDVARSHLWHTHISVYRDSEFRDKRPLFADYFAPPVTPPDTSTEDPMGLHLKLLGTVDATPLDAFLLAKIAGTGHSVFRVADAARVAVADGLDLETVQRAQLVGTLPTWAQGDPNGVAFNYGGEQHFAVIRDIAPSPLPAPPDTTPFDQAAVNASYNSGVADAAKASANGISALPKR